MKKIAFIGLGAMGSRIVKNLIESGNELTVYNRNKEKALEFEPLGARIADTPKEAIKNNEIIMTMVTDDNASRSIWLDENSGIIDAIGQDQVAIDLSTLSIKYTKELASEFSKRELKFLEAPVVGTRPQAEQKQLVVLSAGAKQGYEVVQNVLSLISAKNIYLGESGKAASLKLYINSLFGIQAVAFAELTQALRGSGFDDELINKIVPELPITSPIMKMLLGLMMEDKFSALFPIDLVEKDFGYAEEFVSESGLTPIITKASRAAYKRAQEAGFGGDNISGVIQIYQDIYQV